MADTTLFEGATTAFDTRLAKVQDKQWSGPTPDTEWNVRDLVQHVMSEVVWIPPLLRGATVAEVGDRFDRDLLGDDAHAAWTTALDETRAAATEVDGNTTVHLSYGDVSAQQYLDEVGSDILIHTWDLARAIGAPEKLPPDLVDRVAKWFTTVEDKWRAAGAIGPRIPTAPDADAQTQLLAAFGRDGS